MQQNNGIFCSLPLIFFNGPFDRVACPRLQGTGILKITARLQLQPAGVNNAWAGFKFAVKRAPLRELYLNAYAQSADEFIAQALQEQGVMFDLVKENMI